MMIENPYIEVGIIQGAKLLFSLVGKFQCNNSLDFESGPCTVSLNQNKLVLKHNEKDYSFEDEIILTPLELSDSYFEIPNVKIGIDFHWEQEEVQSFQGNLKLKIVDGVIILINSISIEDYLISVISSEMKATSSINLLKAHAIISRSWLIAQIMNKENNAATSPKSDNEGEYIKWFDYEDHKHFHVCADDHCQRYQGISRSFNKNVINAVKETRGMVLTYEKQICDARYSKSCGGHTELYENCWDDNNHPYLKAFPDLDTELKPDYDLKNEDDAINFIENYPDSFCNTNDKEILAQVLNDYDLITTDFYRWKVEYSQEQMAALIQKKSGFNFGKILRFETIERGESGRIKKLKIIGSEKELVIGKELLIRKWLSETHLYSSAITIEPGNVENGVPANFTIKGAGWGHGVGLCQIGAAVMAEKNYDYTHILNHYYKSARIEKYYS